MATSTGQRNLGGPAPTAVAVSETCVDKMCAGLKTLVRMCRVGGRTALNKGANILALPPGGKPQKVGHALRNKKFPSPVSGLAGSCSISRIARCYCVHEKGGASLCVQQCRGV